MDERKHILSKDCWCQPTVENPANLITDDMAIAMLNQSLLDALDAGFTQEQCNDMAEYRLLSMYRRKEKECAELRKENKELRKECAELRKNNESLEQQRHTVASAYDSLKTECAELLRENVRLRRDIDILLSFDSVQVEGEKP
jgi:septal ring factor EnvC (AmiA/AmiB activator)